jgi:hypothetical protein
MPPYPTPEQQKDVQRLARYIEREQLVSLINDTKWREAIQAIQTVAGYVPRFRVKDLRGPEPSDNAWDGSFPYHVPRPFNVIEWLELEPRVRILRGQLVAAQVTDYTEALIAALRAISVPFEQRGPYIRIWGYSRPSEPLS